MGIVAFLFTYLLGGITFIPLLLYCYFQITPKTKTPLENESATQEWRAGAIEEKETSGIKAYKTGWIVVTQEYLESIEDISVNTQSIDETSESKSAYSSLYKLVKNSDTEEPAVDPTNQNADTKSDTNIKKGHKKHRFYAILKHGNLFLYKSDNLKDVKHVIVLSNQVVTMWPRTISDGQLFTNATAICIMKKDWSKTLTSEDDEKQVTYTTEDVFKNKIDPPPGSIYIYCDINSDKEDWYFSLIRATKTENGTTNLPGFDPSIRARPMHLETKDMMNLIQILYSSEGQLYTKWINALMGRLFLSLQKTDFLHNLLKKRLERKLKKIRKPGFLDNFKLVKLDTGVSAPFITWPSLEEVSPTGDLVVKVFMHYHGSMSFQIATKVNINLGSRFKPREVDLLLAITLEKIEGPMLIKFKPPPSNRIWYSFENEPFINLKIEPVISSRQVTYNIITNSIEKKFKEAIRDSLVLPHWDDFVYYETMDELYRAGIWDKSEPETSQEDNPAETRGDSENKSTTDDDSKSELTTETLDSKSFDKLTKSQANPGNPKLKLTNTINDLSRKLKNSKTAGPSTIDALRMEKSDAGITAQERDANSRDINKKPSITMLKKIGKWYFNDDKKNTENDNYIPPEMILNRKKVRKSVSESLNKQTHTLSPSSAEMFGKDYMGDSDFPVGHMENTSKPMHNSRLSFRSFDRPMPLAEDLEYSVNELYENNAAILEGEDPNFGKHRDYSSSDLSSTHLGASPSMTSVSPTTANVASDGISLNNHSTRSRYRKPPPESPPMTPQFEADKIDIKSEGSLRDFEL